MSRQEEMASWRLCSSRAAAGPAFAMGDRPPHHPRDDRPATTAPEIDAGSGLASVAVVIAALCLAWERRRRGA